MEVESQSLITLLIQIGQLSVGWQKSSSLVQQNALHSVLDVHCCSIYTCTIPEFDPVIFVGLRVEDDTKEGDDSCKVLLLSL